MKWPAVLVTTIIFIVFMVQLGFAGGYWELQGTTAMTTRALPKGATTLLINYNSKNFCRPEVALLIFNDKSLVLGNFVKQKKTNDEMSISIDGRIFRSKVTATKYSNAMEVGFVVNEEFVRQFRSGRNAAVKAYDYQFEFPIEGSANFIEAARGACR